MTELDQFLRQPRTKKVLRKVADGTHELMPCGDIRVAMNMVRRDILAPHDPRTNSFTSSYRLTAKGRDAVATYFPDIQLHERNLP